MDDLIIANPEGAQAVYVADVDRLAEKHRCEFITIGSGQALAYESKYKEAVNFQAGSRGDYPHLTQESNARGITMEAMASEVITRHDRWQEASAAIEAARAKAKKKIRTSSDLAEWRQAVLDFAQSLPSAPNGE